jgi:hypothetical protein
MKKPIKLIVDGRPAILFRGKALSEPPKTYTKIGAYFHNLGNNYNPHTINLFRAKGGGLRYEIYRDGSFYPFYGKIVFTQNRR